MPATVAKLPYTGPALVTSLASNGAQPGYPQTLKLLNTSAGYQKGDSDLSNEPNPWNIDARGKRRGTTTSIGAYDPDAT